MHERGGGGGERGGRRARFLVLVYSLQSLFLQILEDYFVIPVCHFVSHEANKVCSNGRKCISRIRFQVSAANVLLAYILMHRGLFFFFFGRRTKTRASLHFLTVSWTVSLCLVSNFQVLFYFYIKMANLYYTSETMIDPFLAWLVFGRLRALMLTSFVFTVFAANYVIL